MLVIRGMPEKPLSTNLQAASYSFQLHIRQDGLYHIDAVELKQDRCGVKEIICLRLLQLDCGARFRQFGFQLLSFILADAFLDWLRRAVNQVLGFLQAQAGQFAHDLDHIDLVRARAS